MSRILVTGSEGLIGTELRKHLARQGCNASRFDLRHLGRGGHGADVRRLDDLRAHMEGVGGIVHLAAVSRVILGERDPHQCWETNVGGTRNVLEAAAESPHRPWVIMASSREVYGQPADLPANEDCPLEPVNIYGRSKVEGERLVEGARQAGLRTAVVRFSNVFGWTEDHPDRVVPAFARAAAAGAAMRVDGLDHTFDFSHVGDAVRGLVRVIHLMGQNFTHDLPPIHFTTGRATTLLQLAKLANRFGGGTSRIIEGPPRTFDVGHFVGDPSRARALLGWRPEVTLEEGLRRFVADFRQSLDTPVILSA